jgi:hypothetical protein
MGLLLFEVRIGSVNPAAFPVEAIYKQVYGPVPGRNFISSKNCSGVGRCGKTGLNSI